MAAQLPDHRVAVLLCMALDRVADIRQMLAGPGLLDSFEQALFGHAQQPLRLGRDASDPVGPGRIADPAVQLHAAIDADDVPFLEDMAARNTVDDLVVDRDTGPGRVGWVAGGRVAEKGRRASSLGYDTHRQVLKFAGRDARS